MRWLLDAVLSKLCPLAYWAGYRDGIAAAGEALHIEYRFTKRIPKRVREAMENAD